MALLFASIIFDIAQVLSFLFIFFCYLSNIDPNSWITSLIVSMMVVFLRSLGLRLISRRRIMRLSIVLIFVFISIPVFLIGVILVFFDWQPISFWAPRINLSNLGKWLQAGLCSYIDSFFYYFILYIQVLSSIVQLSLYRRT